MYVKSIKLINFRNYSNLDIELNSNLNIFLGKNAQGKTNLLESIYLCSSGKSYRTNRDKELINLDKDKAYIGLEVNKENHNKKIEIKFERDSSKRIRINKVETEKLNDLIGQLNVVIFSPEDLKLIKEGPGERRGFIDNELSQIRPRYRYNINRYGKILIQRNNLLKSIQFDKNKLKLLEVWDDQLATIGTEIIISRIDFIRKISQISQNIHKKITNGIENLEISYLPSFSLDEIDKESIKKVFEDMLKKSHTKDIERGSTEFGPHRDDLDILINGISTRIFGSQGQQRSAALSLKLAEVELINLEVGEYPVLLLDDVLSELDYERRRFLISTFKDIQTIITTTDDIDVKEIEKINKSVFHIKEGRIINYSSGRR